MDDRVTHLLDLVAAERHSDGAAAGSADGSNDGSADDGSSAATASMRRLCQVAMRLVPATGAAVSIVATDGVPQLVAASDGLVHPLDGIEQVTGAGPGHEAFTRSQPVLIPDVEVLDPKRWPGYAAAARDNDVRAVFAVPLQVGSVRLGSLRLYRDVAGPLGPDQLACAEDLAAAAVSLLLDTPVASDTAQAALPYRAEIFQAQGMVKVQLGVGLGEAMARLRAHAFAADRPLADVARDIVARRLVLDAQPEGGGSYDGR